MSDEALVGDVIDPRGRVRKTVREQWAERQERASLAERMEAARLRALIGGRIKVPAFDREQWSAGYTDGPTSWLPDDWQPSIEQRLMFRGLAYGMTPLNDTWHGIVSALSVI